MTGLSKEIIVLILTALLGIFTNIATSVLPGKFKPYLWLSWVPLVICVVVLIVLQFIPEPPPKPEPEPLEEVEITATWKVDSRDPHVLEYLRG